MKDLFKQQLKKGITVFFDNEEAYTDFIMVMECMYKEDKLNTWLNGYKILFNGQLYSYKTFNPFFKKVTQLMNDYNLVMKVEETEEEI